jgi:tRNA pseudouridine55 synthase
LNFESWQLQYADGKVLLIDKPLTWTSFDVVKKIRVLTRISKIGHAGTLDPLATGLLIVCTGKFTKRINEFMAQEKEYEGSFTLGAITPTYDRESEPYDHKPYDHLTEETIRAATAAFTGEIMQVPPIHSAIKMDGKPAYQLARKGKEVKMEPRRVVIHAFEITAINLPEVRFRVVCSTGTYIRSLAFDFGNALGCGAYMSALCRTRIGDYGIAASQTIEEFVGALEKEKSASADADQKG